MMFSEKVTNRSSTLGNVGGYGLLGRNSLLNGKGAQRDQRIIEFRSLGDVGLVWVSQPGCDGFLSYSDFLG